MRKVAAAPLVVLLALLVLAAPASAHAQLVSTQPASGAVLPSSPSSVSVRFDEAVGVRSDGLQLRDAAGKRVDHGGLRKVDAGRTIELPISDLQPGGYVLTWRVVSADGHPVGGGVTWRIGSSSKAVDQRVLEQALNAERGDATVHALAAVFRTLLFLALVMLVGGLAFLAAVWPGGASDGRLRRLLSTAALTGAVATLAGMALQGADVAGLGLGGALRPRLLLDTLRTDYGKAAAVRLGLLLVLGLLAREATPAGVRTRSWRARALVASSATLLTLTLAGHARTGRWTALTSAARPARRRSRSTPSSRRLTS